MTTPPDDYPVPDVRPADPADLLDRLHDTMLRLNAAFFTVVDAERAYERQRSLIVAHHVQAGEAISTAERHARIDDTLAPLHTRLTDARANVTRLEAFAAHWRYLIDHLPGE